jgi:hypothetical protein
MSRWKQRRKRYEQKRNAFLLLTLSGAVRSADVEVPYCRERRLAKASHMVDGHHSAGLSKGVLWATLRALEVTD